MPIRVQASGPVSQDEDIHYAIAVSLEVEVGTALDVYQEIRDRLRVRDRRGFIGKVLLEKRFWKRSASTEDVQSARYSILKDLETFELFETIILLLAWADAEGDPDLWNETCDFYYYIIPDLVLADDIRLRFELLDIVAEYAQKQQKVPYRKPLLSKHRWREQTEILQSKLTERYAALMRSHLLFFHKEELDATRHELAEFIAKIVMSDFSLWDRYSDYTTMDL